MIFRYLCYLFWLLSSHLLSHASIFCILSYLPTLTLQDILRPYIHPMKHSSLQSYLVSTGKAGLMSLFICNGGNNNAPRPPSASPSWPKNMWVNLQFSIISSVLCPTVEISSWLLGSLGRGSNISGTTGEKSIFSYIQLFQLGVEAAIPEWPYSLNLDGIPVSYLSLQFPVSLLFFFLFFMHYTQVWNCCSKVAKWHSCLRPFVTCPPCPFLPSPSTLQSLQHC